MQIAIIGLPNSTKTTIFNALTMRQVETTGRRLVIGTGCVTPITAPAGNIRAAREAIIPR